MAISLWAIIKFYLKYAFLNDVLTHHSKAAAVFRREDMAGGTT